MNLNLTPVEVNIDIESLSLERDAFYNVCFIAEHDTAERHITVNVLKDLLDAGYTRDSLAYNFCVGVFSQEGIQTVTVRAKRSDETYQQAFDAEDNNSYYFIVIDSKDKDVINTFANHIASEPYKLLFYSTPTNPLVNTKTVHYYQRVGFGEGMKEFLNLLEKLVNVDLPSAIGSEAGIVGFAALDAKSTSSGISVIDTKVALDDLYINSAYKLGYEVIDLDKATTSQLQMARLAYPEAAWISLCGNKFPSSVQWLYKYLAKTDIVFDKDIPPLSNTSSIVINDKSVVGSGKTNQNLPIHEQVSIDWVKWAISQRVWKTLYTQSKIIATEGGIDLIVNEIKYILDIAVEQGIFTQYKIGETKLDRNTNNLQVKFTANLTHTILEVEVNGSLKY